MDEYNIKIDKSVPYASPLNKYSGATVLLLLNHSHITQGLFIVINIFFCGGESKIY